MSSSVSVAGSKTQLNAQSWNFYVLTFTLTLVLFPRTVARRNRSWLLTLSLLLSLVLNDSYTCLSMITRNLPEESKQCNMRVLENPTNVCVEKVTVNLKLSSVETIFLVPSINTFFYLKLKMLSVPGVMCLFSPIFCSSLAHISMKFNIK